MVPQDIRRIIASCLSAKQYAHDGFPETTSSEGRHTLSMVLLTTCSSLSACCPTYKDSISTCSNNSNINYMGVYMHARAPAQSPA